MIPARIIHLDAKGSTHAPPHRAVSYSLRFERLPDPEVRHGVGTRGWRLDNAIRTILMNPCGYVDVWLVNGQRVRVRPSAKWLEARKEMFK